MGLHRPWLSAADIQNRIVVILPMDLDDEQELLDIEDKGVKARYVAIEQLQEMEGGVIEWRRLCRINSGGLIPKFWAEKMIPGGLIKVR